MLGAHIEEMGPEQVLALPVHDPGLGNGYETLALAYVIGQTLVPLGVYVAIDDEAIGPHSDLHGGNIPIAHK